MVFRERESQRLLGTDDDFHTNIRQNYLTKFSWKSVALALCAGLIPFLLWVAIFQDIPAPPINPTEPIPPNGLLTLKSPSSPKLSLSVPPSPIGPMDIHNKKSLQLKKPRASSSSKPQPPPTEFGRSSSSPNITRIGNKTVVTYHLSASKGLISPDNFAQPALLLNSQSPGPELRVPCDAILVVHVTNNLPTPLTIHFHGLHQRRSFLSDGVPHVTQNPIPPGGSFTYEINTWPQVGTFFYHAHTEMDIVWLYGPLVIEDDPATFSAFPPAYQYDSDKMFILNGVYHESLDKLIDRISGPIHSYPTIINSLTINGRSFGVWDAVNSSLAFGGLPAISTKDLTKPKDAGYDITPVEPGKRYRFRFINAASDSLLSCNISGHTFTVIEMDGIYTKPVETDRLIISPGQRYSFIITMKNFSETPGGEFWISCRHMEYPGPLNGLAILSLDDPEVKVNALNEVRRVPVPGMFYSEMDRWIVDELQPNYELGQVDVYAVPKVIDKEWIVDVFEAVIGQRHVYLLNGHYFDEPKIPYFEQLTAKINISQVNQVYEIEEGQNIQFVFQNQRTGSFCFSHPWHIHGHSFYVVGQGPNRYDPAVDGPRIQADIDAGNTKYQFRDSVTVYSNQTVGEHVDGAWCGWAAVRIAAHNPGVWLAHCHVTPHMMMGKKFVIWEHSETDPFLINLMEQHKTYESIYTNASIPVGGW